MTNYRASNTKLIKHSVFATHNHRTSDLREPLMIASGGVSELLAQPWIRDHRAEARLKRAGR